MAIPESTALEYPLVLPMTWEQYEALEPDIRHEYIGGALVVNPSPSRTHQVAVRRLANLLEMAAAPGFLVVTDWSWKLAEDEFVPDVIVTPATDEDVRFTGMPELAVEVLSTNRAHDLVRKLFKYAALGLPRYWIADPAEPSVSAYELSEGVYEQVGLAVGAQAATLDFGAGTVTVRPADLLT